MFDDDDVVDDHLTHAELGDRLSAMTETLELKESCVRQMLSIREKRNVAVTEHGELDMKVQQETVMEANGDNNRE